MGHAVSVLIRVEAVAGAGLVVGDMLISIEAEAHSGEEMIGNPTRHHLVHADLLIVQGLTAGVTFCRETEPDEIGIGLLS